MTLLDDLDGMHAEAMRKPYSRERDADFADLAFLAWPAVSAYVKALEAERDASRALFTLHLDGEFPQIGWKHDEAVSWKERDARLVAARRATDAAREAMEKR